MNDVLERKTRHIELPDMEVKTGKDLLHFMHREKIWRSKVGGCSDWPLGSVRQV
jgi:hypothetical protein